jgi:hypothetical protein
MLQTTVTFISQFNLGAGGQLTTTQPSTANGSGFLVIGGLEYVPMVCTASTQFCVSGGIVP